MFESDWPIVFVTEETSNMSTKSFVDSEMQRADSSSKPPRSGSKEASQVDKNNNTDDNEITLEMLRKLRQMEDKTSKEDTLQVHEPSIRKSASFQNITELSDNCTIDLRRRGSDPRSQPRSPAKENRTSGGKRRGPWELRRSSTPIPGTLEVSSVLRKALGRFSSEVGHASVTENEELDD